MPEGSYGVLSQYSIIALSNYVTQLLLSLVLSNRPVQNFNHWLANVMQNFCIIFNDHETYFKIIYFQQEVFFFFFLYLLDVFLHPVNICLVYLCVIYVILCTVCSNHYPLKYFPFHSFHFLHYFGPSFLFQIFVIF